MKYRCCYFTLFLIILSACNTANNQYLDNEKMETQFPSMTWTPMENIPEIPARTLPPTSLLQSIIETPTPKTIQGVRNHPIINQEGDTLYETLFTIPINSQGQIQYQFYADSIHGPIAMGVLPDHHFLISDFAGNKLIEYDQSGGFVKKLDLASLGIDHVRDIRISDTKIALLEISYKEFIIHIISLEGALLSSVEIPHHFSIGNGNTLESSLTGIALDCENNILLEIEGGSILYPLEFLLTQASVHTIPNGYLCYDQVFTINYALEGKPRIIAGDEIFQTELTGKRGGVKILSLFNNGDIYIIRTDLIDPLNKIIDETIHYFSADRSIQGVARLPDFENYYSIMRDTAVGPDGEVYYLSLKPNSISIIRLNFYSAIEPLIPGVAMPTVDILSP